MWEVLLDALIDSLKVLAVAFILYILISFVENKIARILEKRNKLSPLIGSALGLIPQCGIGVVAADLFNKKHISMGTITAIFLACSDEALPILLSSKDSKILLSIIPIILIKFVYGFLVGFIVDVFYQKSQVRVSQHIKECNHHLEEEIHIGCCNHPIEEDEHESKLHKHLIHPLIHSLKIFVYVLIINSVLNIVIYLIGGTDTIGNFLTSSKWISPVISSLVGMIPNCAASVVITEVYLLKGISFGACLSGLCMNAGLGFLILFRNKENLKEKFIMLGIMFVSSNLLGYLVDIIINLL